MGLLQKADELLYKLGEYEEAIKYYNIAIEIYPDNAETLNSKGIALNYLGKYNEAIKCAEKARRIAEKAIETKRDYADALALRGEALGYKGKYDEAIEYAEKAIRINEENGYALYVKAYALDYCGKHSQAIECAEKAIRINEENDEENDEENTEAYTINGIALNYLRNYDKAIHCFDKAIEITSQEGISRLQDRGYALVNKGVSRSGKKESDKAKICYKKALECFDKSINKNPNDSHSWVFKGVSFEMLGFRDRAIRCYDKVIDINPEFDYAWFRRGLSLYYLGKHREALKYFEEAISKNPNDADYYIGEGNSKFHLKEYNDAIKCFDKVIEGPDSVYYDMSYFNRGECKYKMGIYCDENYSEALEDFKKIDDHSDLKAKKHNNVGLCHYQLGSYKNAENNYCEAIESDSKLVEAYYNLGVLYNKDNQPDKAKRQFNACLKVDKEFSKAKDAIEKLKGSSPPDWYNWWFGNGKIKKALAVVLIVSILALTFIVAIIIASIFLVLNNDSPANQSITAPANQSITAPAITGITVILSLLMVILLLPSLKRVKVLDIELETIDIPIIKPDLEALLSSPVEFTSVSY